MEVFEKDTDVMFSSSTRQEETGAMSHAKYVACIVSFVIEHESLEPSVAARKANRVSLVLLRHGSK